MSSRNNPAPVAGAVIAAVAQALLPAVMKAGSNQIEAYKRADMNGKVKLLKKWSVYTLNFQLRLLLQHKPTARRVAKDLDKLLKNKKALKQIETAGRVGLEAGKAYKGAKAKKNGPTRERPHYPFAEKEKQYSRYTTEALYHAMNDAMAASRAQEGWNEAGANWYLDDYHTLVKEIQHRKGRG